MGLILDNATTQEPTEQEAKQDMTQKNLLDTTVHRYTVVFLFVKKYQGLENLEKQKLVDKMNKQYRIIATIRKNVELSHSFNHYVIDNALFEVVLCYINSTKFAP